MWKLCNFYNINLTCSRHQGYLYKHFKNLRGCRCSECRQLKCVLFFMQVLYFSGKVPPSIPFLVEFTCKVGNSGVKCAVKTPTPEMAPLFFEAIEALLK